MKKYKWNILQKSVKRFSRLLFLPRCQYQYTTPHQDPEFKLNQQSRHCTVTTAPYCFFSLQKFRISSDRSPDFYRFKTRFTWASIAGGFYFRGASIVNERPNTNFSTGFLLIFQEIHPVFEFFAPVLTISSVNHYTIIPLNY